MALLKRDWLGSELADFERALLFDADKEHWGWVKWADGGGDRIFTLSKSPFLEGVGDPVYYIFPEGMDTGSLTEGRFVQVDVSGLPAVEKHPVRYRAFTVKCITPIGDRELFEILPRPRLYLDEFRYYSTINFDNAEKDNLDLVLPLQIVSCPTNESGKGGLTVMRTTMSGDKDAIRHFKDGILGQIPSGFKKQNPVYMYRAAESKKDEQAVSKLDEKCSEVNLLVDTGTALKINLPIIQHQSRYHYRQPLSSDVVSYQLSALICKPYVRKEDIRAIESSVIRERKRMEGSPVAAGMKPFTEVKIAEALARMKLTQNNAIFRFLGEASGMLDSHLKMQDDLIKDIWRSQVDAFDDLRQMYDGVGIGGRQFDANLMRRDIMVYLEARKYSQETGSPTIKRKDLKKSLGLDDASLKESLNTLRERGYIIMLGNNTVIQVLDLGEYSDVFDEALRK